MAKHSLFVKQVLDFVSNSPVVAVPVVAFSLLAYVIHAALSFKDNSQVLSVFTILGVAVVIAVVWVVHLVFGYWQRK